MKQEQIDQMRIDLNLLNIRGYLPTVAAVAGASKERYKAIMKGEIDPTFHELTTFNVLKGS